MTHSDGQLLHGIGGWQDALFSRCTILTVPTFRDRVPVIRERVTTLCGPGELMAVVAVATRGLAARRDAVEVLHGLGARTAKSPDASHGDSDDGGIRRVGRHGAGDAGARPASPISPRP